MAGVYSDGGAGAGAPLLQLLILELAIDGLKLAALQYAQHPDHLLLHDRSHHPGGLRGPVRLFSAEVMLYMAVVAIAKL